MDFRVGVLMPVLLFCIATQGMAAPDTSDKVVLANLDRYDAYLKVGDTRREIKPRKASVLTPKRYPVTIEFWSGNTRAGWRRQTITKAGTYAFNFRNGNWALTELKKGSTQGTSVRPSPRIIQRRIVRQPVRRLPINADRNRWSPLARCVYAAGSIYQFVRDEQDRDLLRHLLIRAREDEDWRQLDDWMRDATIPIPHKQDLREAFEDLAWLSDADWNEIDTTDEKDWDQARADLGDLISDAEWDNVAGDFAEIDTEDYWQDDVDVELGDIDFVDNVDLEDNSIDLGEDMDLYEDYDVGDLGIDQGSFDLGGYDDFGGYDGAMDVDVGDYGGGYFGDDDFGDFGGFDDFDF